MTKLLRSCGAAIVALPFLSGAIFNYGQAPSASQTAQTPRPDHIILISVDGMPPDYYTAPEKLGLRVPTMTMPCAAGRTPVTYPQHTTMVTGLRPAAHGI